MTHFKLNISQTFQLKKTENTHGVLTPLNLLTLFQEMACKCIKQNYLIALSVKTGRHPMIVLIPKHLKVYYQDHGGRHKNLIVLLSYFFKTSLEIFVNTQAPTSVEQPKMYAYQSTWEA